MHELGVTKALFDTVMQAAKEHNAKKINDIYLVLGKGTGIEADCVDYYFTLLAEDTLADAAKLHFLPGESADFYIDRMEIEENE